MPQHVSLVSKPSCHALAMSAFVYTLVLLVLLRATTSANVLGLNQAFIEVNVHTWEVVSALKMVTGCVVES